MGNVTIYDIARRTKLSPSTISKALNNYPTIPEATKKKVAKACKDMGYIPNVSAKSLSKRSSGTWASWLISVSTSPLSACPCSWGSSIPSSVR